MREGTMTRSPDRLRSLVSASALILGSCLLLANRAPAQRPDHSGLSSLQRDFVQLVEKLTPAVVRVADRFTGVIVDGRGYVLSDAAAVPDQFGPGARVRVELSSGRRFDAQPIWRSKRSRTALLRILRGARFPNIPAGNSDELRVGDLAITIGNAFDLARQGGQPAVTVGHVAGLWSQSSTAEITVTRIVTTAAINPGTSGGPLIDVRGSLIGINDQRRDTADMGQVMPINFIRESYAECEEAYRVLGLGARKRGRPRRYANFMVLSVVRVARTAAPAVVSVIVTRETKPPPKEPGNPPARKDLKAKKDGPDGGAQPDRGGGGKAEPKQAEPKKAEPKKAEPENGGPRKDRSKSHGSKEQQEKKSVVEPRPPLKERRDTTVRPKLPPKPKRRASSGRKGRKRPTFKLRRRKGPVSGVIVSPAGLVLTATANLWETAKTKIRKIEVVLNDGRVIAARRLGTDHIRGLTLLEVAADGLPALPEAKREEVEVGSFVAALGNPYGVKRFAHEPFLTWGVLSAQNQIDPAKAAYQTDAWINQANQGGALIDMNGHLLGISLLYAPSRYGLNSGVGFAIPMWSIRRVIDRLKQNVDVHPGYLGVRLAPVYEPENRGVRVVKVVRHSPAQRGGLRPGDRILAVNSRPTQDMIDVLGQLAGIIEGERVELEIVRDGAPRILTIAAERRG